MQLDTYRKRLHEIFGKPRPSFYAILLAPPLAIVLGSFLFLGISSRRETAVQEDRTKSEVIAGRELADLQVRETEARNAEKANEERRLIKEEYSRLLLENEKLSVEVKELQKAAPLKAYIDYQQAQEEAEKAEKARKAATIRQQAERELDEKQTEACAIASANFEASKSTSSAEKIDKDFQALKNLCR